MNDSQIENTNEELNNLRTIRDQAINALAPNIDRMEGVDGERKIRIYMSAARITNSSKMFRLAYEAAKNIPDTATRAEALIDIIRDAGYAISKLGGGSPFQKLKSEQLQANNIVLIGRYYFITNPQRLNHHTNRRKRSQNCHKNYRDVPNFPIELIFLNL